MGLFIEAVKTYDAMTGSVKMKDRISPIAPIFHTMKTIGITMIIRVDGTLEPGSISVLSKKEKEDGIIPATEEALNRTNNIAAFPLIDKVEYFVEPDKFEAYLEGLKRWRDFDPDNTVLSAVYKYVSKGTIADDLKAAGIDTSLSKVNKENLIKKIGWIVEVDGKNVYTWKDKTLRDSYTAYCLENMKKEKRELCMICGELQPVASSLPSVSRFGNAKLVSSNDVKDFTYRGRFCDANEALTIGTLTAQKVTNALAWLFDNFGVDLGKDKVLLCWNPEGHEVEDPLDVLFNDKTEKIHAVSDYKKALTDYIYKRTESFSVDASEIVTGIFEKVSKGHISMEYYSEKPFNDFLSNLAAWDASCCWYDPVKDTIRSPSLFDIIKFSYGTGLGFSTDSNIINLYMSRLVERRIENGQIPYGCVRKLIENGSNLQIYSTSEKSDYLINDLLFTICSVLRKYNLDKEQKEYSMELEKNLKDRSYQFGRLLAVCERIEIDAIGYHGKSSPPRTTNAIRMQHLFVKRPGHTYRLLIEKLKDAYYGKYTKERYGILVKHEKTISEILEVIASCGLAEFDNPLGDTYIVGYTLQRNEYFKKN